MKTIKKVLGITILVFGAIAAYAAITLSVTFESPTVTCTSNGASVSVGYTTSASDAASTTITETLTNSNNAVLKTNSYVIDGTTYAWTIGGRLKTFDGTFTDTGLADGTYSLQVCADQKGSNGNPDKQTCSTQSITVACNTTSACPSTINGFFGEVDGNPSIGHGNGSGALQIQVSGDFGGSIRIEITGPNSFDRTFTVAENGTSCIYHANWQFTTGTGSGADVSGNGGPGVYSIYVWGANNSSTETSKANYNTTVTLTD
jgi:hypothetical protein